MSTTTPTSTSAAATAASMRWAPTPSTARLCGQLLRPIMARCCALLIASSSAAACVQQSQMCYLGERSASQQDLAGRGSHAGAHPPGCAAGICGQLVNHRVAKPGCCADPQHPGGRGQVGPRAEAHLLVRGAGVHIRQVTRTGSKFGCCCRFQASRRTRTSGAPC